MRSLRTQLVVSILAVTALAWLLKSALMYLDARREMGEMFNANLAQSASVLRELVWHEFEELDSVAIRVPAPLAPAEPDREIAFQIVDWGGHVMFHSAQAPGCPLPERETGFSDRTLDGERWRVFTLRDAALGFRVHTAARLAGLRRMELEMLRAMLPSLALSLPLLIAVIWILIARLFRPLQRLTAEVSRKDPLSPAPLDRERAPAEVAPLVSAINSLLGRLDGALERERRFTADAAHELRTPLAGIRTQAQVALRAGSDPQRRHALDQIVEASDEASQRITQLLLLARMDSIEQETREPVDLEALSQTLIAELTPPAMQRGVCLALESSPDLPTVSGSRELFSILMRNLLENAVKHTRPGTEVEVRLCRKTGAVEAVVRDRGPGIPPEEHTRVFERFFRTGATGVKGSGLGLSIVKRIAELYRIGVTLETPETGTGLAVRLRFPGQPPPPAPSAP
ncbi:MAG: ATP-binding protein [Chromatiales bacterium]|jgi:two-component system sensor histidine kinase QseC